MRCILLACLLKVLQIRSIAAALASIELDQSALKQFAGGECNHVEMQRDEKAASVLLNLGRATCQQIAAPASGDVRDPPPCGHGDMSHIDCRKESV